MPLTTVSEGAVAAGGTGRPERVIGFQPCGGLQGLRRRASVECLQIASTAGNMDWLVGSQMTLPIYVP